MTNPSPTCWLYLNCEDMTGQPAEQCPNRKRCKRNANHSENRSCELPYHYWQVNPQFDQLFDHPGDRRLTVLCFIDKEAIAAGWHPAEELFWVYRDNTLWIGNDPKSPYFLKILPEAKELGFAQAESMPYSLNSETGKLHVSRYVPWCTYPQKFLDAGWCPAIDLPYCIFETDSSDSPDPIVRKGLYVDFPFEQREYHEALEAGWHPPCPLFEFEDPDHDFYGDDEEDDFDHDY
jgi:hypothetical protein